MVYTEDSRTWNTAQPGALANADNGTSIACLTMPTTERDINNLTLQLEQASGESRCYFQRDGHVREVVLNGTDWADLGSVPMS